jgi:hypothetical protein
MVRTTATRAATLLLTVETIAFQAAVRTDLTAFQAELVADLIAFQAEVTLLRMVEVWEEIRLVIADTTLLITDRIAFQAEDAADLTVLHSLLHTDLMLEAALASTTLIAVRVSTHRSLTRPRALRTVALNLLSHRRLQTDRIAATPR